MLIYPTRKAQIALPLIKEVTIPDEYSDYVNVFLEEKALILLEWTKFNQYIIKLKKKKQPPCGPIISLGPLELDTLKTYIKTHLKTGFIQFFKSSAGVSILFDKNLDSSFCLCIDYWGFNKLIIKNWYLLLLIDKLLDWLKWAKKFTQLDLTSV